MTTLYDQSIPTMVKYLTTFSTFLDKLVQHAEEKQIKQEDLLAARLAPNMKDFTFQVQAVCNTAVLFVERLLAREHETVEDNEATVDELRARLQRTVHYLEAVPRGEVEAVAPDAPIVMASKVGPFHFDTTRRHVAEYVLPNFFFHLSIGYCILRNQGVPLGALDFLRDVFNQEDLAAAVPKMQLK